MILHHGVTISDLLAAELLAPGTTLVPLQKSLDAVATVLPDGRIACGDEIYSTLSGAGDAVAGVATDGWTFWIAETLDGAFTPAALCEVLRERES